MTAGSPDMSITNRFVSDRATSLWLSGIKEMAMLAARIDDAVSLAWGIPSFPTPAYIRHAVIQQLDSDEDIGKYALPDGLDELRNLVADKHEADTGVAIDADDHVVITAGNMQGMYLSLIHISEPTRR